MSRTEPPTELVRYIEIMEKGVPKCCHSCLWYDSNGACEKHAMRPPDEFTVAIDACHDWEEDIPF